jgi:hypothetical protein
MPVFDIIVLSCIVTVFTAFGVVLAFLTWYCSDKRKQAIHRGRRRSYDYPTNGNWVPDDD